jgi:hypothetical protein
MGLALYGLLVYYKIIYLLQTLAMKARDQECHLLTDHQHYPQQTWVSAYVHEDSSVLWRGVV